MVYFFCDSLGVHPSAHDYKKMQCAEYGPLRLKAASIVSHAPALLSIFFTLTVLENRDTASHHSTRMLLCYLVHKIITNKYR